MLEYFNAERLYTCLSVQVSAWIMPQYLQTEHLFTLAARLGNNAGISADTRPKYSRKDYYPMV